MRSSVSIVCCLLIAACARVPSDIEEQAQTPAPPPPPIHALPEIVEPLAPLADLLGEAPTCSADVQIRGPVVSIFPGQTVCLSFELESGYLVPHATPEPYADSVVLRRHESAGGAEPRMAVFNPFALPIKYRAGMRVPDEPRYLATSSFSVIPGGVSSELWWHEIEEIVVANFHFLEDPEAMICN